jgi:hypothetical protein
MNAAKVADAVISRMFDVLTVAETADLRNLIIEEIGKEVVTEASVTNFWRFDRS